MAVEQVEQLRLQRGAGTVGVEIGEERILGFFQHDRRVEPCAKPLGERGFARADRAFDRDVAELQGGPMISSRREDRTSGAAPAEAPARPLLRDQLRPHRRQTFHPGPRVDGDGVSGYGECVAEAGSVLQLARPTTRCGTSSRDFIAPRVLGVDFAHPRDVFPALKAIRGHNMAKAAVEMAAWDLYARQRGEPLSRVLGGTRDRIASGVSIGIQDSLDRARRRRSSASWRPAIGGSRSRSSPAGTSTPSKRCARRFGDDPADGRCQRRLHAGRRRSPGAARSRST